jgi:hypothetical protein
MTKQNRFAQRVFLFAAIYGILVLAPQYVLETRLGVPFVPPLSHPEHFYGFIGVALAWQFAFLVISRDVQRYRLLMLPAVLEKLSFGIAAYVLYAQGRVEALVLVFASIDLLLAALFLASYRLCRTTGE